MITEDRPSSFCTTIERIHGQAVKIGVDVSGGLTRHRIYRRREAEIGQLLVRTCFARVQIQTHQLEQSLNEAAGYLVMQILTLTNST